MNRSFVRSRSTSWRRPVSRSSKRQPQTTRLSWLERRSDISVIFTDVEMPGRLNGFELARIVQDHHQRVRIIVGSGRVRPGTGDIAPHAVFLAKPYAADALVRAVQSMVA